MKEFAVAALSFAFEKRQDRRPSRRKRRA